MFLLIAFYFAIASPSATPAVTPTRPATKPNPAATDKHKLGNVFSGKQARKNIGKLTALGPRYTTSPANYAALEIIKAHMEQYGWTTRYDEYILPLTGVEVDPNVLELLHMEPGAKSMPVKNLVADLRVDDGPTILLGVHHDTRILADADPTDQTKPTVGANDGGSGCGVLMELARLISEFKVTRNLRFVFFDTEDSGRIAPLTKDGIDWEKLNLDGLISSSGDERVDEYKKLPVDGYVIGSLLYANSLDVQKDPIAEVIVLDMVGDSDQQFPLEGYGMQMSSPLAARMYRTAQIMGHGKRFDTAQAKMRFIVDDHYPFALRGINALDIIDLDYPHWHRLTDTLDKVKSSSLGRIGKVAQAYLERVGALERTQYLAIPSSIEGKTYYLRELGETGVDLSLDFAQTARVIQRGGKRMLLFVRGDDPRDKETYMELLESEMDLETPNMISQNYMRILATSIFLFKPLAAELPTSLDGHSIESVFGINSAFMAGLGGGEWVRFWQSRFAVATLDTVDIEPQMIQVAEKYFGTVADPSRGINIWAQDGVEYLEKEHADEVNSAANGQWRQTYDVIIIDAFTRPTDTTDSTGAPVRFRQVEFLRKVKSRLNERGILVVNSNTHDLVPEHHSYLEEVFSHAYVLAEARGETTMVAFDEDREKWTRAELRNKAKRVRRLFRHIPELDFMKTARLMPK